MKNLCAMWWPKAGTCLKVLLPLKCESTCLFLGYLGLHDDGNIDAIRTAERLNIFNKVTYVTGFWKTDQIGTLGLFRFNNPANNYTLALSTRSQTYLTGLLFWIKLC